MTSLKNNTNVQRAVPFFMVVNMECSLNFYVDGLDFEVKNKWEPRGTIEWCWLQLGNTALMLQEYRQNPPPEKLGVGVGIYFICEEALEIYKQVIARGLSVNEPFVGNRMWVVSLRDPDGYNIFFESDTNVAEETMYSDWIKTANPD